MFELSVALKYLKPRWRQLSVSIISIISILVIALVVWLIVVFFSVTNGLEKNWIQKLTALTAPIRIRPTEAYYNSYYYQVDSVSMASNYTSKTIGEKLEAEVTDPYDPTSDEEIPPHWPKPAHNEDGSVTDLVKKAYQLISSVPGLSATDYEMTFSNLRLRLIRTKSFDDSYTQSFLSQATYVGSFDPDNPALSKALLKPTTSDFQHLLEMLFIVSSTSQEQSFHRMEQNPILQEKLKQYFNQVHIDQLKTPSEGWFFPRELLPSSGTVQVFALIKNGEVSQVIIPQHHRDLNHSANSNHEFQIGTLLLGNSLQLQINDVTLLYQGPLILAGDVTFPAELSNHSLESAKQAKDLHFNVSIPVQNLLLKGEVSFQNLEIAHVHMEAKEGPFWINQRQSSSGSLRYVLPTDEQNGEGIVLPKTFREAGVLLGDRGYLSYYTPTASSIQEQRIPIYVVGFYDPGIIPIGGKFILASSQLTSMIRSSHNQDDPILSNGINIRLENIEKTDQIKNQLQALFEKEKISPYWHIETFREYDFTKDLLQQLQSDKNLFTLISTVIIIVACSNIISMLIILVNDKKIEIGILRSMGASSLSIGIIFGTCGIVMGVLGSLIGTFAALATLKNLELLVRLLSRLQGYQAFNPMFYGETLPNQISYEALAFVVIATGIVSLIAGIVPAVKASLLRPSAILRSE